MHMTNLESQLSGLFFTTSYKFVKNIAWQKLAAYDAFIFYKILELERKILKNRQVGRETALVRRW